MDDNEEELVVAR